MLSKLSVSSTEKVFFTTCLFLLILCNYMYEHLIFFFAADLFMSFCPSCKCNTLFQPAPQPKAKKAEKKKRKRPKKGNVL